MCVHSVFQEKYKEMRGSSKTFAQYWGENVSADELLQPFTGF